MTDQIGRTVLTCPELNPEPSSVQHESEQLLAFWGHNPADFGKMTASENWVDYPENYPQTTLKTTQKTTQKIIGLIMANPNITRAELSKEIGLSEEGIKFSLNKKKEGKIKRIGPDK